MVIQSPLAQAEELWEAASVLAPTSRPLPLFYALSQVTRPVSAAWVDSGPWQRTTHGLKSEERSRDAPFEAGISVAKDAYGVFRLLA